MGGRITLAAARAWMSAKSSGEGVAALPPTAGLEGGAGPPAPSSRLRDGGREMDRKFCAPGVRGGCCAPTGVRGGFKLALPLKAVGAAGAASGCTVM